MIVVSDPEQERPTNARYRCPKCGEWEHLQALAAVVIELLQYDPDVAYDGSTDEADEGPVWDLTSQMECRSCLHTAEARAFLVPGDEPPSLEYLIEQLLNSGEEHADDATWVAVSKDAYDALKRALLKSGRII